MTKVKIDITLVTIILFTHWTYFCVIIKGEVSGPVSQFTFLPTSVSTSLIGVNNNHMAKSGSKCLLIVAFY
jgi:hypothetical protein